MDSTDRTKALKTLIILDDEPMMIQSLKRRFAAEGCEYFIKGFVAAEDALRELENGGECYAFITDIKMPEMHGDQVIEEIREKHPSQRCIVISGYATKERVSRIVNAGNTVAILTKPLVFERLVQALDDMDKQSSENQAEEA